MNTTKESPYGTDRKTAAVVGVLFIIGTVSGVLGAVIGAPILGAPDYLSKLSANEGQMLIYTLLIFIMGVACAGIGLALYPILKKYNAGLAIGTVGFRVIEGVLDIVAAISIIALLALSQEFVKAGFSGCIVFSNRRCSNQRRNRLAEPWRRVAVLVHRRLHVLLAVLSIPACPALALRLGVRWHYLSHHRRRTGHAACHPRLGYRADASQSADIPAGDGLGGLADRQRCQFVGSRFSVCGTSDERASERGIDLHDRD